MLTKNTSRDARPSRQRSPSSSERPSGASVEPVPAGEPMLTVAQAAWLTGLAKATLASRHERDRLRVPYYKLTRARNGRIGFRRSELEAWLRRRAKRHDVVALRDAQTERGGDQ
jgi:predicted DNA-binding transcriptional regulator AlpA